jgi:CIC family chloride channel protein
MISRQLQPEPIYEALALQEGVVLPTGESREELYGARVSEVMKALSEATPLLAPDSDTGAALAFLDRRQCNSWPAGEGHFTGGLISRRDLEAAPRPGMKVKDLLDSENGFPHVHADHPVSYALERMREGGVDVLPVVSRASIHEISGVIGLRDILESYGVPDAAFFSRSIPG